MFINVYFDSECIMCDGFVKFILRNEKHSNFHFVSNKSTKGQNLMEQFNLNSSEYIVVQIEEKVFVKSTAVLIIMKNLRKPWCILGFFLNFIPSFIRDYFYDFVAKRRYKIFGKQQSCEIDNRNRYEL
jgi:predicted DCC family thiol-disulfide oxidoreductase YuxK